MKRHTRVRGKVSGTSERPRLNVFRSGTNIYAQIIDDIEGRDPGVRFLPGKGTSRAPATTARLLPSSGRSHRPSVPRPRASSTVVFDRGGYLYHGRVKALAEGAREGGLEF